MQLEKGSAGFQPVAAGILPTADRAWTGNRFVGCNSRARHEMPAPAARMAALPISQLHRSD